MGKRIMLTLLFFYSSLHAQAGGGEYAVSKIPQTLLKNANVVKRFSKSEFEVISFSKTRLYEKYAITILNENGDKFASLYRFYDQLRAVKSIEGKLYDKEGNEIRSLKNKEIQHFSPVSSNPLMEDIRDQAHSFSCKNNPYTTAYAITT